MAEQSPSPALSDSVTPAQFFEQLMPMGFAVQREAQGPTPDVTLQYHVTGEGGGDWTVRIAAGEMTVATGTAPAAVTTTIGIADWRDCVLERNGATLALLVPQGRQGRPENAARLQALKGTLALELSRDEMEPLRLELSFNDAATPRTTMKMKLKDYVDMQTGKLNGQEAFMTGRLRVEGDLPFLMQIAAFTQ
jgi:hypothetical protein